MPRAQINKFELAKQVLIEIKNDQKTDTVSLLLLKQKLAAKFGILDGPALRRLCHSLDDIGLVIPGPNGSVKICI